MKRKIILIGFMGSGKSSVARELAKRLGLNSIEMDVLTVKASKRGSIAEIFEKDGEAHFRSLEAKVAGTLAQMNDCVIATGGGVGANEKMLSILKTGGKVIYLRTSFETIQKRIGHSKHRPLFSNQDKALQLYTTRQPLYEQNANFTIETDGKTVDEIVENIMNILQ